MDNELNYMNLESKEFFSEFLNLARHNAFITLSHISQIILNESINKKEDEDPQLAKANIVSKLKDGDDDVKQKIVRHLEKYFKFLPAAVYYEKLKSKRLNESNENNNTDKKEDFDYQDNKKQRSDPSIYHEVLVSFLKPLDAYRNYYSHYGHPEIEAYKNHKEMIKYLDAIFDSSVRICIQRFGYQEKDIKHLRRYDGAETDKTGKRMAKLNPKFFLNLTTEQDKENELNTRRLAFFISLFLEKKQANDFLKKLKGFKDARTTEKQSTFEIYTAMRLKLPKQKIYSDETYLSIAADLINELQKCPDELYDLLSDEDKDKFRVEVSMREDTDDYEENGLFKRFNDRFPYFALKYFDYKDNFDIRFHVNMGKYYFKFYDKKLVNGETEIRKLDKNLKTFGRIQELEKLRQKDWTDLLKANPINKENTEKFDFENAKATDYKPYIQDTFPHYIIKYHKIGLQFTSEDILPNIETEKIRNPQQEAWLSTYELVGMVFYDYLNKNAPKSASSELLKNYYFKIRKLFEDVENDRIKPIVFNFTTNANKNTEATEIKEAKKRVNDTVLNTYNIDINDLPESLQRFLIGKSAIKEDAFIFYATQKINKMIEKTEARLNHLDRDLKKFGDKGNKYGSKNFKEIKSGNLADFLAKDMLFFQPSLTSGKDKVTGMNFQVLQANLAMYNENRLLLTDIFKQCKLIDSEIAHPFLNNIKPEKNLMYYDFYKNYLLERKKYLTRCRDEQNFNKYYFLQQKRKNIGERKQANFIKTVVHKYLNNEPINFPRGLFCDAIRELLNMKNFNTLKSALIDKDFSKIEAEKLENNLKTFIIDISKTERTNTVYIIQKFFEIVREDKNQEFYDYKRSYKFINELYDSRRRQTDKLPQLFYSVKDEPNEIGLESLTKQLKTDINKLPNLPEKMQKMRFVQKIPRYKEPMQKSFNEFKTNEQLIRLYKVQDMTMLLMSEVLLQKDSVNVLPGMFKLKNIVPPDFVTTERKERWEKHKNNEKQKSKDDSYEYILNHAVRYNINYDNFIIFQDNLKIKNVGDFIRFTKDRRMKDLLKWYEIEYFEPTKKDSKGKKFKDGKLLIYEVNRLFLENEFAMYEKSRLELLKKVMTFEKIMFDFYKKDLDIELSELNKGKQESEKIAYFDFKLILNVLEKKIDISKDKNVIKEIRNKFLHNQFPELKELQNHELFKNIKAVFGEDLKEFDSNTKKYIEKYNFFGKELASKTSVSHRIVKAGIEILDKFISEILGGDNVKEVIIKNFKSIYDTKIELSRVNIFIGENGCGKSNILEAFAVAGNILDNKFEPQNLFSKGVRLAKPSLFFSSFNDKVQTFKIEIETLFSNYIKYNMEITCNQQNKIDTEWDYILKNQNKYNLNTKQAFSKLSNYVIYSATTMALRGFSTIFDKEPLGLNGEGLDLELAKLQKEDIDFIKELNYLISWLDDFTIDTDDKLKYEGFKPNKSSSKLYFSDKFMNENSNFFSSENANEGVLHLLFYFTLFISDRTPKFFAIDNIESSLNPHLCRELMNILCKLAKKHNKQVLITTHNPAILDGLNLFDNDIRLFEVARNDDGHTVTRRIELKPEIKELPIGKRELKLSDMWTRGFLGAISQDF